MSLVVVSQLRGRAIDALSVFTAYIIWASIYYLRLKVLTSRLLRKSTGVSAAHYQAAQSWVAAGVDHCWQHQHAGPSEN